MTDKELIARLREAVNGEHDMTPHGADCLQAADRIEALTAKLAKAVEALGIIKDRQFYRMGPGITAQVIARATLAEIEGEKG
jgi:hypothetical protein